MPSYKRASDTFIFFPEDATDPRFKDSIHMLPADVLSALDNYFVEIPFKVALACFDLEYLSEILREAGERSLSPKIGSSYDDGYGGWNDGD